MRKKNKFWNLNLFLPGINYISTSLKLLLSALKPVKQINMLKRKTHTDAPGWRKCGKPCHIWPYTLPAGNELTLFGPGCFDLL